MQINALLFGGVFNAIFNLFHIVAAVFGGVVFVMDVAPRRPDMLRGVNRILFVGRIGEFGIAVFMLAPLRTDRI